MTNELRLTTEDGESLEAERAGPDDAATTVVMCHPHPAYGGDMRVPVLTDLMAGLAAAGHGAIRFNFRSAGDSTGVHDFGDAERRDVVAAVAAAKEAWPELVSSCSATASAPMSLAAPVEPDARVLIAPPLQIGELGAPRCPTLLLVPELDQFSAPDHAREATAGWPDVKLEVLSGADHFLTGAVPRIVEETVAWLD